VDRFFSKLDLRDIKIDPFKTSFPPDAEEEPQAEEPQAEEPAAEAAAPPPTQERAERRPHVPAWAAATEAPAPLVAAEEVVEDPLVVETEAVVLNGAHGVNGAHGANGHAAYAPAAPVDGLDTSGEVLKVSARSRPSAVAGAIAGVVREMGRAEVQAIGAGATNQAVKAVAIARDYLRETGIEAVCLPAFIDITIENEDRTAIRLVVEPR